MNTFDLHRTNRTFEQIVESHNERNINITIIIINNNNKKKNLHLTLK